MLSIPFTLQSVALDVLIRPAAPFTLKIPFNVKQLGLVQAPPDPLIGLGTAIAPTLGKGR